MPWILFWLFTHCKLVLSYVFLQSVWYFLHTQSIFNQSEHIQSVWYSLLAQSILSLVPRVLRLKMAAAATVVSPTFFSSVALLIRLFARTTWSQLRRRGGGSPFGVYIENLLGAVFFPFWPFHGDFYNRLFTINDYLGEHLVCLVYILKFLHLTRATWKFFELS